MNWNLFPGLRKARVPDTVPVSKERSPSAPARDAIDPDPDDEIIAATKTFQGGPTFTSDTGAGSEIVVDLGSRRNLGHAWTDYLNAETWGIR